MMFCIIKIQFSMRCLLNSLRHSAGPLAIGQQAQSRGFVKPVGVKGWFDDDDQDNVADEAEEDDDDHRDEDDVMM
jgi:hypothetical protein